jgi:Family of unknown function (DUF6067)
MEADEWRDALSVDGFLTQDYLLEGRRVHGYISADPAGNLYLAVRSQLPDVGPLLESNERASMDLVYDDSVEIWIEPRPDDRSRVAYQLLANSGGFVACEAHAYKGASEAPGWKAKWKSASSKRDGDWHFEASIPASALGRSSLTEGGDWTINLCRNWKRPWVFSSMTGGPCAAGQRIEFSRQSGVSVQQFLVTDPRSGEQDTALRVRNDGGDAVELRVLEKSSADRADARDTSRTLKLGRGEQTELSLRNQDQTSDKLQLVASVRLPGGRTLFERYLWWRRDGHRGKWVTRAPAPVPAFKLDIAVYPSFERLDMAVDTRAADGLRRARRADVALRRRAGATVWSGSLELSAKGTAKTTIPLPSAIGDYDLRATVEDDAGKPVEVTRSFERRAIEGEGTRAGSVDAVYPPFEPVVFDGTSLTTTLRKHTVAASGLWDQVVAQASETGSSAPLLESPMRVLAVIDGKKRKLAAGPLRVIGSAPHQLTLQGGLAAGPLRIDTRSETALDGATSHTWTLLPSGDASIDQLVLEIPLRGDQAPLMHAMTDGLRDTAVSARVPQGKGTVWNSSVLLPMHGVKNWCSYIFLGSAVRGLAWYAENDAGWSWDEGGPNVELVREGASVVLRIHLVSRPLKISAARTLRFGLQAAPIKKRLPSWRYRWTRDNFSLLGTDINWFGGSSAGSLYPVQKDLFYWHELRENNQHGLSAARIAAVRERGIPYWSDNGADVVSRWKDHVDYNLGPARRDTRMVFYFNRASSPVYDEFKTFQDEWSLTRYRDPNIDPTWRGDIMLVPSRSYDDVALYWYAKSFEHGGNTGVYWDNWFIQVSSNTTTTAAYELSDGRVRPAAGIAGLRELSRRTFNWLNETRAQPVVTMPHMTSTSVLPMLGYATFQLDWEWRYGEGPVQKRFSREYLQLVSTGELAGTVPVTLLGPQDKPFLRSDAAVRLVHELDMLIPYGRGVLAIDKAVRAIVAEPELVVYRYWDERPQPVNARQADVLAIDYVVPRKRTLVGLASWSDQTSNVELLVDWRKLGIASDRAAVRNVEDGSLLEVRQGRVSLRIAPYDLALLEIVPAGRAMR